MNRIRQFKILAHLVPSILKSQSLRCEVGYWKTLHRKAIERESELEKRLEETEAKLRLRERQLFSVKTEKNNSQKGNANPGSESKKSKRPRGQQKGKKGHNRRNYDHLPQTEHELCIPDSQAVCGICSKPFEPFPGTEDSKVLEIEVKAHKRIYKRKRYTPTCECDCNPGIILAPPAPKLIPRGIIGVSIWVEVLLDKFWYLRPTYRFLRFLKDNDLDIAQGTITDGLKKITSLFTPIYEELVSKSLEENRWSADETRWSVFILVEGKVGYRWYMWVFASDSAIVYILDPTRSAKVPENHFDDACEGILLVDRYSAYKAFVKTRLGKIILAFCWAHVRRDFIGIAKDWPIYESWAMKWVEEIARIYHLNNLRLKDIKQPKDFKKRNRKLKAALNKMKKKMNLELSDENLHPVKRKCLISLRNHWDGLTVFVKHPEVPMDNNFSERLMRPPAVARKGFYGSGSIWSGELIQMMFSIFQTLNLFEINPKIWLKTYLESCARNQGRVPSNLNSFLPWNFSEPSDGFPSTQSEYDDSS